VKYRSITRLLDLSTVGALSKLSNSSSDMEFEFGFDVCFVIDDMSVD
jgi:hypothetical protein